METRLNTNLTTFSAKAVFITELSDVAQNNLIITSTIFLQLNYMIGFRRDDVRYKKLKEIILSNGCCHELL